MIAINKVLKWTHNLQASCFGTKVGVSIEASISASGNKMLFVSTSDGDIMNNYILSEDMATEAIYSEWGRLKDETDKLLSKFGRRINKHGNQLVQFAP